MTDRRLLIFTTLARTLSFSETATQLGITQPAVSKCTAKFVRYGRSVSITVKGDKLKALAEKILEGYSEIDLIKD